MRAKKSAALALVTDLKCFVSSLSAAVSASVAAAASSGVGASSTTSIIWKRLNASSKAMPRWRHGKSFDSSESMSEVIEKCVAA